MSVILRIEVERETDEHRLAEVVELPGVLVRLSRGPRRRGRRAQVRRLTPAGRLRAERRRSPPPPSAPRAVPAAAR